jgi:hypothetical protein
VVHQGFGRGGSIIKSQIADLKIEGQQTMSPTVTQGLLRAKAAGRKLGAGAFQAATKVFTFGYGVAAGVTLVGVVVVLVGVAAFYALSGGVSNGTQAYRHRIPILDEKPIVACGAPANTVPTMVHPVQLGDRQRRLHEPLKTDDDSAYDCAIQHHVNQSVHYDLAFLEFNDAGKLIAPQQWTALQAHLKAQENLNVLVFVHGWRNDAHVGSEDVERFHTLLSLSANYAQQRNGIEKPATKTIGIFIGWRGRVIDEKSDANSPDKGSIQSKVRERLAIPTILSRKPRSDAIAKSIGQQILNVEALVKGADGERHGNKLVIVGHSLGGNIVIQGLSDKLVERITSSQSTGRIRGVGDLVVLINPASQARHFFAVQQAAFANMSPPVGSPVVVSLTAAKYFDQISNDSQAWDTAVGKYFTWAQQALTLTTGRPEDVQSIGNYLPSRVRDRETKAEIFADLKGVSHEIELDGSANKRTTYAFAGASAKDVSPTCPVDGDFMGWQKSAINHSAAANKWDTDYRDKSSKKWYSTFTLPIPRAEAVSKTTAVNSVAEELKLDPGKGLFGVNIRHGAIRHQCLTKTKDKAVCRHVAEDAGQDISADHYVEIPVIGPAWSPVWNVAAHSNVIDEHGGYLSHTLWCVLNRFALDRPAPVVSKK